MTLSTAAKADVPWRSDVIGVSYAQLEADYWLQKLPQQAQPLMSQEQIKAFNQQLVTTNPDVVDPLSYFPASLDKNSLIKLVESISSVPSSERFYADGASVSQADFKTYQDNLALDQIKNANPVRYGIAVARDILRTFPTHERVFNRGMDTDLDRFQETGIFPGDPVAVLHASRDNQWYLVQNYHYLAWVPQSSIALGDKQTIGEFHQAEPFVVVTGSKVFTNYVPEQPAISELQLDMGTRLPLVKANELPNQLYGQNPYASYTVRLPVRNEQGQLEIKMALIARGQDLHLGYLDFTHRNIIKQAFKFLGERYGWGHDYNARDCTGFVGDIYKTFGFMMPRNTGQQDKADYGQNNRFDKQADTQQKMAVIEQMKVGDLIYIPGHVMMYLGEDNGQPYIIHDVKGLGYMDDSGNMYHGTLNGVSVTPLLPLRLSAKTRYVDRIDNIKRIGGVKFSPAQPH
ncbi:SH3 domain-containing protein [Neptunicella sp. SCSIO 80796]|uniref:C40 family peptidase n=1 Tax=Neptunicella plasticusilytica TaxID=3117012 RepID=UPI003A4E3B35